MKIRIKIRDNTNKYLCWEEALDAHKVVKEDNESYYICCNGQIMSYSKKRFEEETVTSVKYHYQLDRNIYKIHD
jgi:hypothetical protein